MKMGEHRCTSTSRPWEAGSPGECRSLLPGPAGLSRTAAQNILAVASCPCQGLQLWAGTGQLPFSVRPFCTWQSGVEPGHSWGPPCAHPSGAGTSPESQLLLAEWRDICAPLAQALLPAPGARRHPEASEGLAGGDRSAGGVALGLPGLIPASPPLPSPTT